MSLSKFVVASGFLAAATGVAAQQQQGQQQMQYPNFFTGELRDLWGELEQTKDLVTDNHCKKQTEFMKEINKIGELVLFWCSLIAALVSQISSD